MAVTTAPEESKAKADRVAFTTVISARHRQYLRRMAVDSDRTIAQRLEEIIEAEATRHGLISAQASEPARYPQSN